MSKGPNYPVELPPINIRKRLLERLETDTDPELELTELQSKLARATQRMESVGDGGRYGLALAMRGLEEYFSRLGLPQAVLYPLNSVLVAIEDARSGIQSPIFKPDRAGKKGAPPSSILRLELKRLFRSNCGMLHTALSERKDAAFFGARVSTGSQTFT